MIFGRFIDLGIWTGAMEALVLTLGTLLLAACMVRLMVKVALYAVRAVVRLKRIGKAKGSAIE